MTSQEKKRQKSYQREMREIPTEDLPRSDDFPDSSETECPQCDKMLTREEIDKHMKTAHE